RGNRIVRGALRLWVLHRHLGLEELLEREPHALEGGPDVAALGLGALQHLHSDRHAASSTPAVARGAGTRRAAEPLIRYPRSSTRKTRNMRGRLSRTTHT